MTKQPPKSPEEVPAVHCSFTELVPLENIKPNPRNPNTHPEKQIALLARIINSQGWRAPITVSRQSGYIVRGHARYAAAVALKLPAAPVDFQEYVDEASEQADMIADNRLAELAQIDRATLKDLLSELDTGAFDMSLTGFDDDALEALMTASAPQSPDTGIPGMVVQYNIVWDDEAQQQRFFDFLKLLKGIHPEAETIAARLDAHMRDFMK